MKKVNIEKLNQEYSNASAEAVMAFSVERFGTEITLASSLGAEDQVLTHMYSTLTDEMDVFVLDTGRLHQETYDVLDKTRTQYAFNYRVFFPNQEQTEAMVREHGPNHFYESVDYRKECCFIRKVEPLQRALKGYSAWITGIRRAQSIDRTTTPFFEWDSVNNIVKVNPLIKWSKDDVWNYINRHEIPYNILHDKGFPSIGCVPCTRAVPAGEDDRSGRWWWEDTIKKECGLHVNLEEGDS
ncbi:MAG: phosphoadenylyl-sulfate reductase [Candidatus Margulisiibacteriota bacterium]|nr:phosphoadenylyl-sulfate reductase [Candidatus Margulisiibacteriota bacterium]